MPITAITIENFKGIEGPLKIELKPIILPFFTKSAGKTRVDKGIPNGILHELSRRLRQGEFSFVVISVLTGGNASNS